MLHTIRINGKTVVLQGFSAWKSTIRSVYFPDEVSLYGDAFMRFILSTSNIPVILLVFSATQSILQCVVWMLIIPVVQDIENYATKDFSTADIRLFVSLLWDIGIKIAPFATVSVCAVSASIKMIGCFGAAMVDSNASVNGLNYPLLCSQLRFIFEKRQRFVIWSFVVIIMSSMLTILLRKSGTWWLTKEPEVFFLLSLTLLSEVIFAFVIIVKGVPRVLQHHVRALGFFRLSRSDVTSCVKGFGKYFKMKERLNAIYYMRCLALLYILIAIIIFSFQRGVIRGVTIGLIALINCGVPHVFLAATLHVAIAIVAMYRSFYWLFRHPDALILVFVISFPYQVAMILSFLYFLGNKHILLLLFCNEFALIVKAIDIVREFDMSEYGSVRWIIKKNSQLVPPTIACILEDAYEKKQRFPGIVSLDMAFDLSKMQIVDSRSTWKVARVQVFPSRTLRRLRFNPQFYLFSFPRLLSLQNRGDFSGAKFRAVRIILRFFVVSMLVTFVLLVSGIVLQACFPFLRPPPVRAIISSDGAALHFDHIVVHLSFLAKVAVLGNHVESPPKGASFNSLNEVRSGKGEDFFPALCTREYFGTSVFEVAVVALLPYLFSSMEVSKMLEFLNTILESDWELQESHGSSCSSAGLYTEPSEWKGFINVYSPKKNLTIVAIRGTDMFSFKDLLMDVNLYFETVLYQFVISNVPGSIATPTNLVEDLIGLSSFPVERSIAKWDSLPRLAETRLPDCQTNNYRRDFFADVTNHLTFIGSRNQTSQILLTGHSMGGSIAAIVGSQMHIQTVSFGSPGILLARKKFNISVESFHRYVTTVVSSNDLFPLIGRQGGEVHHMVCLSTTKETCHAMEFMIGTLWRSCSSIRERFPLLYDMA